MPTKLQNLLSESAVTGTPEHTIYWNDESGENHAPMSIFPRYAEFSITSNGGITGNTTNGINIISSVTGTVRARVGAGITGTGIPASTTISAVDYAANTITISQNATADGTAVALSISGNIADPVISFGYNIGVGANSEIVPHQGSAGFVIEGHFEREGNNDAWMESYVQFDINGSSGQARPFFFAYDKVQAKTMDLSLSPGVDRSLFVYFEDYIGSSGGESFKFTEGQLNINAPSKKPTKDVALNIGSHAGQNSILRMTANGESFATAPSVMHLVQGVGGGLVSKNYTIVMQSSSARAVKTGKVGFRADDNVNANSIMMNIGSSAPDNTSVLRVDSTNMATNYVTFDLIPKASQTRGIIEAHTINNGTGAVEARGWQLYPKGYIAVRESGNTSTDRNPSTGANTVTLPTTNCPGVGTSTAWFPILDTAGALFWVPGVSNA